MGSNFSICVKIKCDGAFIVYQLSMFISIHENEILTGSVKLLFSILSVNCSHLCIIFVKIFEKILSGGLEVSFSIFETLQM